MDENKVGEFCNSILNDSSSDNIKASYRLLPLKAREYFFIYTSLILSSDQFVQPKTTEYQKTRAIFDLCILDPQLQSLPAKYPEIYRYLIEDNVGMTLIQAITYLSDKKNGVLIAPLSLQKQAEIAFANIMKENIDVTLNDNEALRKAIEKHSSENIFKSLIRKGADVSIITDEFIESVRNPILLKYLKTLASSGKGSSTGVFVPPTEEKRIHLPEFIGTRIDPGSVVTTSHYRPSDVSGRGGGGTKKQFDKPLQKKELDKTDPAVIFYRTLYKETEINNSPPSLSSKMAIKWLVEHGVYNEETREILVRKYTQEK